MTSLERAATFPAELAFWRQALDRYTPEQLADGASDDDWSLGQLFVHLGSSALRFHLPFTQRALTSTDAPGELSDIGRAALSGQETPPRKVPASPQYTPKQPESAAAITALFEELETAYAVAVAQVQATGAAPGTVGHPALGHLTAADWLALIPVHFHGHRRQLARLDARVQMLAS